MFLKKQSIGREGEEAASNFLKNKGFSIIERNYRKPWGEIDIIAKKDKKLHFIEVKSTIQKKASYNDHLSEEVEERVTPEKRKKLSRIVQTYLFDYEYPEEDFFIDVCAVYIDENNKTVYVKFIEDIELL